MFLGWYDNSKVRSHEDRIRAAAAAFFERFGFKPAVAQVNEEVTAKEVDGIQVVVKSWMQPNNYWLGVVSNEHN